MGNPLFQNQNKNNQNPIFDMLNDIKAKGPSNVMFNQMYQSNPDFKQFADQVRGMTPEQAFKQHGLDFNQFKGMRW